MKKSLNQQHTEIANKVFGIPYENCTQDEKNVVKQILHGSNYGISPDRFAEIFGEKQDAKQDIKIN